MNAPKVILLDIEGTTTEISFVHRVLFPYAVQHLTAFLTLHEHEPHVEACLQDPVLQAAAPMRTLSAYIDVLQQWIAEDRKVTVLKTLQGWIWAEGYAKGDFTSHVYEDVLPALKAWKAKGIVLGIYSSGSVEAQKQLFQHTAYGDLTPFFSWHFDTKIGGKRETASYLRIAEAVGASPSEILFFSDIEEELDAAGAGGVSVTQVVREGTPPSDRHQKVLSLFSL